MTKRLELLKQSLIKKERELEARFETRFEHQRQTNGQPMNDKRNGQAFFSKCERLNEAIRNQLASIERTKAAISKESFKIQQVYDVQGMFPQAIKDALEQGQLIQWRKHPMTFFVKGVDKGRIVWKDGQLLNRYYPSIPTVEQKIVFKDVWNTLKASIK